MDNPILIDECVKEMEKENPEMKRSRVKNISQTCSREFFGHLGATIAAAFPDYTILVDGGPFRRYDYWFYADVENKKIYLDFYFNICNTKAIVEDIINTIKEKWVCPRHEEKEEER